MRRAGLLLMALLLVATLAFGVCAATGASGMSSFATVSSDGSCQVSMTVTFHMEQAVDKLYFPIPKEAVSISLNGSRVSASRADDARQINMSRLVKGVVGDVTASIHYTLPDVIHATEDGLLEMRIPMLSGFSYPVDTMTFSVTMPGAMDVLPSFVSGYHQARIEEDLTYQVEGATITGASLKAMKDHETMTMTLAVTEEMFPQSFARVQNYDAGQTAMLVCMALALLIWLISMWNLPVLPKSCTEPPDGFAAGQLGSVLAGQGTDLTIMVLSWAKLGYVLIRYDRRRAVLYKQMEMGNERSEFEQRLFHKLFGKRTSVDTSGYQYAQLCRMAAGRTDGMKEMMKRFTGNPKVFRLASSGIGLFGGACLAVALADGAALQGLLIFVLGALGGVSGWYMQEFGAGLILNNRRKLTVSLATGGAWLVLGLLTGAFPVSLQMVGVTFVAGLLLAWGGRRTAMGRQLQGQVLGLKWYLRTADKQQLRRISEIDSDYFFRMAPCALALGMDRAFAKRFGKRKLERCPYLDMGKEIPMTALQWSAVLRNVVDTMEKRARVLPFEKLLGMIHSITKR